MTTSHDYRPELLAPAGDWDALRAAVANGADAVYFGLSKYSARQRAANFDREELADVIAHLHGRNVRGYVALNTLIFSGELAEAAAFVEAVASAGADAAIVQDLGLARLIRRMAPALPVHASTQMTLTEPRGIEFVRQLGLARVILARELSIADIRRIAAATAMPLEVFVHGALCMSYSGQCLASETLWGRSANRGMCGQACRLPYRLLVDGRPRDLGDKAYLLSTKDLAAYDRIADLVGIGVAGFKIEGRLKSAHYVAAAVQVYRAAIDAALAGRRFSLSHEKAAGLVQSFSRGFTHGFLDGADHLDLVHGRTPKSRGVRIGKVLGKTARGVVIELDAPGRDRRARGGQPPALLKPGDGIVFDAGRPDADEQGGRIFAVDCRKGSRTLFVEFGTGDVSLAAIPVGSTVWKTDDPRLERELARSYARDTVFRRVPITVRAAACTGLPLRITVADAAGNEAEVAWDRLLEKAEKRPLTAQLLREQFGRLGDTPFELAAIVIVGDLGPADSAPVMVPKSVLNDLRRRAVATLLELRERRARHAIAEPDALTALHGEIAERLRPAADSPAAGPMLCVLVRTPEQLAAAIDWRPPDGLARPTIVYCDISDAGRWPEAVAACRAAGLPVGLATPRIAKPAGDKFLRAILHAAPDAVLARNLAGLDFFRTQAPGLPLIGDFSLNVANEIAAALLAEADLARITPAYDCNFGQFAALAARFPPERMEPIVHAHVPMMYMEHCLAAARLADARDARACGRACEGRRMDLADRIGAEHPLAADARCGSTLFSARVQSAARLVPEMLRLGLRHFRVELLRETAGPARAILDLYARALAGLIAPHDAWRQLETLAAAGVTQGTWDFP